MTRRLPATPAGITEAARLWRDGALVAFPTETVYGLGADATNGRAVAAVFEAKGRPAFNPLIVHVPDLAAAEALVDLGPLGDAARAFWPGPLTLVAPLRAGAGLSSLVSAGNRTLAIRVPDHPLAMRLLRAVDRPIAAPSANPSGKISPTRADHVLAGLEGRIDAVIDGGPCPMGLESTILGLSDTGAPLLLRPGGLPVEALTPLLGALATPETMGKPTAPGQLASHYAPRADVSLNVARRPEGALWLGFGPDCAEADLNLSPTGDLHEAAANLFAMLHELDARKAPIAVAPVPDTGLGRAINDRLTRAAAPRR